MKLICTYILLTLGCALLVESKVYTRCGLTSKLLELGFPRTFVGNWVCLIESESAKDTSKRTLRANGSYSLGLFQINSKSWCTFGKAGGKCNVKCEDLTDENLEDDSACAKKVQGELGFQGWDGWKRNCYRRKLPIPNC